MVRPDIPLVIGVGNPERGDDGVGRLVCRRLRELCDGQARFVEHSGEAASLLTLMETTDRVFVVDACLTGAEAGEIRVWDGRNAPVVHKADMSTHGFGVAAAIELGRALDSLPAGLMLCTIEAGSFDIGAPLSEPVKNASERLVEMLRSEIDVCRSSQSATGNDPAFVAK